MDYMANGMEMNLLEPEERKEGEFIWNLMPAEDKQGNLWVFVADGYSINDDVTLIMNDNHTTKITDDKIIKVK